MTRKVLSSSRRTNTDNARSLSEVFRQTKLDQDDGLIPGRIRKSRWRKPLASTSARFVCVLDVLGFPINA